MKDQLHGLPVAALQDLYSNLPFPVAIVGTGGAVLSTNGAMEGLFGKMCHAIGEAEAVAFGEAVLSHLAAGPVGSEDMDVVRTLQFQHRTEGQADAFFEFTKTDMPGSPGAFTCITGINVTLHRQEVRRLAEVAQQKDTFLGIASHELKTPLTSLKLYSQVLERLLLKSGDEKNAALAHKMDVQVVKLNNMIEDLLDVTRINAGKTQMNIAKFNFHALVKEVVEDMRVTAPQKIIFDSADVGTVFADRDRVAQVVANLLSNAVKYSPDAKQIIVTVQRSAQEVVFSVQDFGIGLPPEKKDKIFGQYYRIDGEDQTTFPGLGLGLFIASQIIARSGGRIWVNSVLGEGSIFSFALPVS